MSEEEVQEVQEVQEIPTPVDATGNLTEQMAAAASVLAHEGPGDEVLADAKRLAQLVLELNDWLEHGGTMPDQWQRPEVGEFADDGEATIADPDANPFGG